LPSSTRLPSDRFQLRDVLSDVPQLKLRIQTGQTPFWRRFAGYGLGGQFEQMCTILIQQNEDYLYIGLPSGRSKLVGLGTRRAVQILAG
jgi:hypothetical protein